ncbi:MAG TPA: NUDIX hydrolase [Egibacteraceae bacterium]|nr:NUDIX hydrolase [Egibacteraceae bacterium]
MTGYEVRSSRVTHDGVLSTVRVDQVVMPDGDVAEREVVEHANAVAVVPVEADGQVVLISHYRHAVGRRLLEIPAGKLDVDGESALEAARRELTEEVGLVAGEMRPLLHFYNSSGWTDEATTVYLAGRLAQGKADSGFTAEAEEADLQVVRMPLTEALSAVDDGTICDAKTVIGLLLAARHLANDDPAPTS